MERFDEILPGNFHMHCTIVQALQSDRQFIHGTILLTNESVTDKLSLEYSLIPWLHYEWCRV